METLQITMTVDYFKSYLKQNGFSYECLKNENPRHISEKFEGRLFEGKNRITTITGETEQEVLQRLYDFFEGFICQTIARKND